MPIDDYFRTNADGAPIPDTFYENRITHLIGPSDYFSDLESRLAALGTGTPAENSSQFIYIANWTMGLTHNADGGSFSLGGVGASPTLREVLLDKAGQGVDVRVLGWISTCVLGSTAAEFLASYVAHWNRMTFETIRFLREESESRIATAAHRIKACMNVLAHPRGSSHAKLVILGDRTTRQYFGYTGGLDFVSSRHNWHDVVVKVEGPAVQGLYGFFRELWNEQISRNPLQIRNYERSLPSVTPNTPTIDTALPDPDPAGSHTVQNLRTIPSIPRIPLSFAPNGLFEIREAWFKALSAARQYIYIEDQYFWSDEVMNVINGRLRNNPELKVILVGWDTPNRRHERYALTAVRDYLFDGLTGDQESQVALYRRTDTLVHAKTTIIDDRWAIIGSANCNRRGLYTDIEHSLSIYDDEWVPEYRIQLWANHFHNRRRVERLDWALNVWSALWGSSGHGVTLREGSVSDWIFPEGEGSRGARSWRYDNFEDPDCRSINSNCWSPI